MERSSLRVRITNWLRKWLARKPSSVASAPNSMVFKARALEQWINALSRGDTAAREDAAKTICWLLMRMESVEDEINDLTSRGTDRAKADKTVVDRREAESIKQGLKETKWPSRSAFGSAFESMICALCAAVKDTSPIVRTKAIEAIGSSGVDSEAVRTALAKASHDNEADVRKRVPAAVQKASRAEFAVPLLMEMMRDGDEVVRALAVQYLGECGGDAKSAVPKLLTALRDPDAVVRSYSVTALAYVASPVKSVVPVLVSALADENSGVQFHAIEALGNLGSAASEAIPNLTRVLDRVRASGGNFAGHDNFDQFIAKCITNIENDVVITREQIKREGKKIVEELRERGKQRGR